MGSIVHAAERIDCENLPNSIAWAHSDSDQTLASGPCDPATPRDHADCHGHHIAVPMAKATLDVPPPLRTEYRLEVLPAPIATGRNADLRPPIA